MIEDRLALCYHAVSPDWPSELAVTPQALEWQTLWLLRRGYVATTFWELVHRPPARKAFAITFDDGWVSVGRHAEPLLSRLGVVATVFVAAALVDAHPRPLEGPVLTQWRDGPHRDELQCLSWPELRQLAERGWEIGAHSLTHPLLTRLDDGRLAYELGESRRRCEEALDRPCRTMAYPTGDFDARVERAVAAAGYEAAAALPTRFESPRPLAWPRISVQRADGPLVFRLKASPLVRRARRTPVWPLLDAARGRLGLLR